MTAAYNLLQTSSVRESDDYVSVQNWLKSTADKSGKIGGAANLARVLHIAELKGVESDLWDFVIGVNLTASYAFESGTVSLLLTE